MDKLIEKLKAYDIRVPLKDNLAQVKNLFQMIVSFIFAFTVLKSDMYVAQYLPADLYGDVVDIINVIEAGSGYLVVSFIEFLAKE